MNVYYNYGGDFSEKYKYGRFWTFLFSEKTKLSVTGQIGIKRTTKKENNGMFGTISVGQSKKETKKC